MLNSVTKHDNKLITSFADQLADCRQRNDLVGYMVVAERIEQVCPHLKPHIKKIEFWANLTSARYRMRITQ